jgi:hypothetical protein
VSSKETVQNVGDRTFRVTIDELTAGWVTRSFPHLIPDSALYVADNVVFNRDGLVGVRPGNEFYGLSGGGNGKTGSGLPILAMTRFVPPNGIPQLIVHSGVKGYVGNDNTGGFSGIGNLTLTGARGATFAPVYDPDRTGGPCTGLLICDGQHVPQIYNPATGNANLVRTGVHNDSSGVSQQFLPNGRGGVPLTPAYVCNWKFHIVYAGQPDEPSGLYISDALRPELFNGYGLVDSTGGYIPYFPGGRDGSLGAITGIQQVGQFLVIFYANGIVSAINTGTYGAYQYEFAVISAGTGCPSPRSIVAYEGFIVFFGGDRFYATDGQNVVPLPDNIPSVYQGTSGGSFPSEMVTKGSVVGIRRGQQYWACYDNVGNDRPTAVAVFDFSANNGWEFGQAPVGTVGGAYSGGGAWSRWPTGMTVGCGVECRNAGDNFQMFWGSSFGDVVAQHDNGTYDDFGAPIAGEIRAKAFFLEHPISPKKVYKVYLVMVAPTKGVSFSPVVNAYVILDASTSSAPAVTGTVGASGVTYGSQDYGTFTYGASEQIIQLVFLNWPQENNQGNAVQPGFTFSTTQGLNLIAIVLELVEDEPQP